ncbi:DegT/DnrJ/EryC1/StrS family aminotransferase [Candidatus Nitrosotenuis uzonensis]|uniref:Putative pyridoxal-phosphate dependent aminotransferase n=1 Tax=Candidatus Nitrosotenuis uzonensis TaxID=1407055 RepID=A0A812F1L7_9ARCH|nr:DegT/DnrJ/EryC1/StrS aminotransferase family protein [Candidatus Nitrosotenuis uzonensis]CAE6488122.1 putative pyridoxal-phosphate dependent aminotransferase [Candidatus Nitrosotenuis uzonensis]
MRKKIFLMRPRIDNNELKSVKKVLQSKMLTEGEFTDKFEQSVARYVHARYAIATTSATTAIHTALECLDVKKKKVLVSDFTFPATALAVILAGGIPVLADVDKKTMNITKEIIDYSLTDKINYILPVSLFGNPLELEIYQLRSQGLKIIEDAATNLGTQIGDKYVGSLADVTCFSFHPRKIITTGEGGMITTNNKSLAERCKAYKTFGKINGEFSGLGTNYKISDILSAVGLAQMKKLENIIKKRVRMAKIYNELLSKLDFVEIQEPTKHSRHTYQSYVCYITKQNLRDKIRKRLAEFNIETQIGTYALHCLPTFRNTLRVGRLENSEFLYKNSLTLPLHEELTEEDQEFVCNSIKKVIR